MQDLELFKQIPGYKAILKAVLKNQIQSLVHQLSEQTGEESMFITASLDEGTLSHLGSEFGKTFLEGHDEIKSKFLGFCLKKKQIQSHTKEFQPSNHGNQWSIHPDHRINHSTSLRSHPYRISKPNRTKHTSPQNCSTIEPRSHGTNVSGHRLENDRQPTSACDLSITNCNNKIENSKLEHSIDNSSNDFPVTNRNVKIECSKDKSSIGKPFNVANDFDDNLESADEDLTRIEQNGMENGRDPIGLRSKHLKSDENGVEELLADIKDEIDDDDDDHANGDDDNTEYVYTGLDDVKLSVDETDREALDETLDLSINNQNSSDSYENSENEIKPSNGCYGTQCDLDLDNCDVLMKSSGYQGLSNQELEKCKRNSKLNTMNFFKTDKSLKERKLELENYLNLDNPDRPYPCTLCPKRFKERHHLVYHLRTHSGHRPYVCNICGKSFTQSSSLNTHKKLHLKDMTCDFCGKVFRKISLLQNHACCT